MKINDQSVPMSTDDKGPVAQSIVAPNSTIRLHVAYRSQGLNSWRYQFGDGVTQARNFQLVMQTNFPDIDFSDDTLSPTSR